MINQVLRYEAALKLIGETRGSTLADVGSGAGGLAPLLGSRWSTTALDDDFTDYGATVEPGSAAGAARVVRGDARRLPFGDREFDVTVALDLLEHVKPRDRQEVCRELARVTAGRVIVGCPAGRAAEASDAQLFERVRRRGLTGGGWLEEHVENGFPCEEELRAWLGPYGELRTIGNENLCTHSLLMRLEMRRPGRALSRAASTVLFPLIREDARGRSFASLLVGVLRGGDRRPTYRLLIVVDRHPPAS